MTSILSSLPLLAHTTAVWASTTPSPNDCLPPKDALRALINTGAIPKSSTKAEPSVLTALYSDQDRRSPSRMWSQELQRHFLLSLDDALLACAQTIRQITPSETPMCWLFFPREVSVYRH